MKHNEHAFDRGLELWHLASPKDRTAALVLKQLQSEGYRVSKASVCRWALKWQQVAHAAADLVVVEHKAPTPVVPATIRSAEPGIPAELRGVLPERLLHVARAGGVDAVEGAARALSEAIGDQATSIAKGGERKLRTVVAALGVLAGVIERIAAARATTSVAHRTYAEGDRLLAEARKSDAEAQAILADARADKAKEITPIPGEPLDEAADDADDEVMALLRESRPPQSPQQKEN